MKQLLLILFLVSSMIAYAQSSKTILVTEEMINQQKSCPRPSPTKQLACYTYHQTTSYTCGPAVVMTLLRYYGKLSSSQMNKTTELRIAKEMGASNEGVTQSQMENWLENNGFRVDTGTYVKGDSIIDNINHGVPTIVSYNRHWILAKGYQKSNSANGNDEIYFSDSCCGISVIPKDTIDSIWQNNAINRSCNRSGNFGEYIIATPR